MNGTMIPRVGGRYLPLEAMLPFLDHTLVSRIMSVSPYLARDLYNCLMFPAHP